MKALELASEELVAFFTASCGGHGHNYERTSVGDRHPSVYDESFVAQIDQSRMTNRETPIARFDAVRATLESVDKETRDVLRLVYEPFGTWFSTGKHSESKRGRKRKVDEGETPDRLARALRPSWGGGSFVRLAVLMPETADAYRKQFDGKEASASQLRAYLAHEAIEPGSDQKPIFKTLRKVCEGPRTEALKVYDLARKARRKAEKAERERRQKAKQAEREALLEEELQMTRRIARARFERMLTKGKSCPTQ